MLLKPEGRVVSGSEARLDDSAYLSRLLTHMATRSIVSDNTLVSAGDRARAHIARAKRARIRARSRAHHVRLLDKSTRTRLQRCRSCRLPGKQRGSTASRLIVPIAPDCRARTLSGATSTTYI